MSKTAKKKPRQKLNTREVEKRLNTRYSERGYAILFEVANATGGDCRRHADAIAFGLWPSRGLSITGFEIKVSRSDWTKELKNPAKAQAIAKYCDEWYVVLGDESIVQPGELPKNWGLMVPYRDGLKVTVEAPSLEATPIDRGFLMAVVRKIPDQYTRTCTIAEELKAKFDAGVAYASDQRRYQASRAESQLSDLKKRVAEFEESSGLKLPRWGHERLGTNVREYLEGLTLNRLRENSRHLRRALAELDQFLSTTEASE